MKKLILFPCYVFLIIHSLFSSDIPISFAEIAQTADIIFIGTIEDINYSRASPEAMIVTEVEFHNITWIYADEHAKQKGADKVKLSYIGGTIGDRQVWVSGSPVFKQQQRYMIFAYDDGQRYMNPLIGGNQGLYKLIDDNENNMTYILSADDRALIATDERSLDFSRTSVKGIQAGEIISNQTLESSRNQSNYFLLPQSSQDTVTKPDVSFTTQSPVSLEQFIEFIQMKVLSFPLEQKLIRRNQKGHFYAREEGELRHFELSSLLNKYEDINTNETQSPHFENYSSESRGTPLGACGGITPPIIMEQVPTGWWSWPIHQESMNTWNMFMPIFRSIPSDGQVGQNGIHEFMGWQSGVNILNMYPDLLGGFVWGTSAASTIIIQQLGNFCGEILEAEVVYNPNYNWTNDLKVSLDFPNVILLQPVTMHELGHVWGFQNGGSYPETYQYDRITVMQAIIPHLVEDGRGIHHPDAYLFRRHYNNNFSISIPSVEDVGVESYFINNSRVLNASLDAHAYKQGDQINVQGITVENMSTSSVTDLRLQFYLSPDREITPDDLPIGGYFYANSFPAEAYNTGDYTITIPENIPSGRYFVGARITINGFENDDFMPNNYTFINSPIAINEERNVPPNALFDFSPDPPEAHNVIWFDAVQSTDIDGQIVSYNWDFGDGYSAQGEYVPHLFEQGGEYDITLTVTDNAGVSASITKNIKVFNAYKIYVYSQNRYTNAPLLLNKRLFRDEPRVPAKICADGSKKTTLFAIVAKTAGGNNHIELRIKEDPYRIFPEDFGTFGTSSSFGDSLTVFFEHPNHLNTSELYKEIHLELYDNQLGEVVSDFPIEIYRAPVVMIHGLWADGTTFDKMVSSLQNTYPEGLLLRMDYGSSADQPFGANQYVAYNGVRGVMLKALRNGYSAGKVNVVAHSMGGILTRMYLQSTDYGDDIARFVTLNTPHSGSQMANFLLDDFLKTFPFFADRMAEYNKNPTNGAIESLKVTSPDICNMLNGLVNLNRRTVPSHAILTHTNFTRQAGWGGFFWEIFRHYLSIRGNISLPGTADVDNLLDDIYDQEQHDLIVAYSSQKGGLPYLTTSDFSRQWHGSPENLDVIQRVMYLLDLPPNDPVFHTGGYHPPKLKYDLSPLSWIDLIPRFVPQIRTNLVAGRARPGETLNIEVNHANTSNHGILMVGAANLDIAYESWEGQQLVYNYEIPTSFTGELLLTAMSFGSTNEVEVDTLSILVEPLVELDSISLAFESLVTEVGGVAPVSVFGHYQDGVTREITYLPDVSYEISHTNIAELENAGVIRGVSPDTTSVSVSYAGYSQSLELIVLAANHPTYINETIHMYDDQNPYEFEVFPNPFRDRVNISYDLNTSAEVGISIWDLKGSQIYQWLDNTQTAGKHTIAWHGIDQQGEAIPPGVYICKIRINNYLQSKKIIYIK